MHEYAALDGCPGPKEMFGRLRGEQSQHEGLGEDGRPGHEETNGLQASICIKKPLGPSF